MTTCCHYDDGYEAGYEKALKDVREVLPDLGIEVADFDLDKALDVMKKRVQNQRRLYEAAEKQRAAA